MAGDAMTRVVVPFNDVPLLFVRIVGKNGKERELRATINPVCQTVVIPRVDALHLGYEPGYMELMTGLKEEAGFLVAYTTQGLIEVTDIWISEMRIGDIVLKNVRAVPYDIPMETGIDVILGHSVLSRLKVTIDYEKKQLIIEDFQTVDKEKEKGEGEG